MAKKKRGRKMPAWRKWAKAIVGVIGKGIGTAVAISPTFRGLQTMVSDPQAGVNVIVFDVTGMDPASGNFTPDVGKLIGTGVVVAVGIGIMKLFSFVARKW